MSAVTPYSLARLRFSISISVSALAGSSRPATARLLRDRSTPPRSTRQVIARASRTRRESVPSSSSSSSPSCRFPVRIGGTGKASPSVSVSPSRSVSGAKSAPTRSSGPCRSMSKLTGNALRGLGAAQAFQPRRTLGEGTVGKVQAHAAHPRAQQSAERIRVGAGGAERAVELAGHGVSSLG